MNQTGPSESAQGKRCFTLIETTVMDLGEVRLGLANVWEESFVDTGGEPQHGVRGTICFMHRDAARDFDLRVSHGSEFSISDQCFRVIALSEGKQNGSLTFEQIDSTDSVQSQIPATSGNLRPWQRLNWIEGLLPIPFLCMPYVVTAAAPRASLAALSLCLWLLLMRPTWKGLSGFYASSLLLLHALFWLIVAVYRGVSG